MMRLLLGVLFLLGATATGAAELPPAFTVNRAEFLVSDSPSPPEDSAAWQPITLPDNWRFTHPGLSGQMWYRLHFTLTPKDAQQTYGLFVPRNSAISYFFFVNKLPLVGGRLHNNMKLAVLQYPMGYILPSTMLRVGDNVVHIRVRGAAMYHHGLSRISIGRDMRRTYLEPRWNIQILSIGTLAAALLLTGLLALLVWRGERGASVLPWFGATSLSWSLCGLVMLWPPLFDNLHVMNVIDFLSRHLYVTPLLILCLRVGGARQARTETALWCLFAGGGVTAAIADAENYAALISTNSGGYLILGISVFAWLLYRRCATCDWTFYFLCLALVAYVGFAGHDWAQWMGYVDFDDLLLAPFAAPFLIVALGVTIADRYLKAMRGLEFANAELEQRVADKAHELAQTYERMQETQRDQAVLRERQRLMSDMHDGLSGNLVSLLSLVQSRTTNLTDIEQRLNETLIDLRAIVDSLEPVEGDLGVVLGNVRYRMRTAIEESGAKLQWQVEPLPTLDHLTPERILAVQRVVLEALTNSLRHANAQTISVCAKALAERSAIAITIADDGIGFDPSISPAGRGLRNMRTRAERMGLAIEIRTQRGAGTIVALELPFHCAASSVLNLAPM